MEQGSLVIKLEVIMKMLSPYSIISSGFMAKQATHQNSSSSFITHCIFEDNAVTFSLIALMVDVEGGIKT